jgi:hypothetical protein
MGILQGLDLADFMLLFCTSSLSATNYTEAAPWDWTGSDSERDRLRSMTKVARRQHLLQEDTKWQIYSCFRATNPGRCINAENPPAAIRAFAADYDAQMSPEAALQAMADQPAHLMPNWIEVTLGRKIRCVWLFEEEFNTPSMSHADAMLREVAKTVRAERLLPAYDDASVRCAQRWSNGGEWYELEGTQPLSSTLLAGLACEAAKKADFGRAEIDIMKVAEEVAKRFPNRWVGDFALGTTGVRFWDPTSDNPRGAFVTPAGMHCVTGVQSFVTWDEIFGTGWVRENRAVVFGEAAKNVFFDGTRYWRLEGESFEQYDRSDTQLYFASRGLSRRARRGENTSEAEQVLLHVQTQNRVATAVPLIFRPPGMQLLNGTRILNISTVKALPPSQESSNAESFPWLMDFFTRIFTSEHARDTYFAWQARAYRGALEMRPLVGQALFFCGPKNNGKSLLCTRIISPLLGGKMANPYDFMMKATAFNSEIFSCGLLAINDEDAPRTEREKEIFLQRLKSLVVNQRHQFHAKFKDRSETEWVGGRVVVTANDDAKSSGILPELNSNTEDKMMFFSTRPYGKGWLEKYDLEAIIAKELPFFARWLLDGFVAPPGIIEIGSRCGVKSYHEPALVDLAKQQESAYELRELLVTWFRSGLYWMDGINKEWTGTPTDLFSLIGAAPEMVPLLKDWTVPRIARSLVSLSRVDDDAVEFVKDSQRHFVVRKDPLTRKHMIHEEAVILADKPIEEAE